jgi:hypothetical protein
MWDLRRFLLLISASAFAFVLAAHAQDDAPSLGDVARQSRQQKQQKDAQAKAAQAKDTQNNDAQSKDTSAKEAQGKDSQGKDKHAVAKDAQPKASHVISNDEIPEHIGPTHTQAPSSPGVTDERPDSSEGKASPEYWKSQIQMQKNAIANLKSEIDELNASIQYAGANCVSGCVQWNERQKQKQDQVDAMKSQLEQMQKNLEDMQETARRQGYGSSVYDP